MSRAAAEQWIPLLRGRVPPQVPAALLELPNVVLSPHRGGCSREARQSTWTTWIDNVLRLLDGQPQATHVFPLLDEH
jgi:phosphoglycerate dehydrogenase-like enzyme